MRIRVGTQGPGGHATGAVRPGARRLTGMGGWAVLVTGVVALSTSSAALAEDPGPVTLPDDTLVADGGFEPPGLEEVGSYDSFTTEDPSALGAWRIQAAGVDLVGPSSDPAAEGVQFVDLNGNQDSEPGQITQEVPTEAGRRYRVEFQLAGNPNGDPPVKTLTVALGEESRDFSFDSREDSTGRLSWTSQQFDVSTCEAGPSTLTFTSTTEGQRGPLVDAISVTDVGETDCDGAPVATDGRAGWHTLLLAGTGLAWVASAAWLGLVVARRRRATSAGG